MNIVTLSLGERGVRVYRSVVGGTFHLDHRCWRDGHLSIHPGFETVWSITFALRVLEANSAGDACPRCATVTERVALTLLQS